MTASTLVGWTLVAGLVIFLTGAVAWRLSYERPLEEALPEIHRDRRRRVWIHIWMIVAMFVTSAGLAGFQSVQPVGASQALASMAFTVYVIGAVCWICSLVFRLTVETWAAELAVETGAMPTHYGALNAWAGGLYCVHMAASYVTFATLGASILASVRPAWLGWLGIGWGLTFLAGFIATRFAGPFNPPFLAHTYTAVLGVALLLL